MAIVHAAVRRDDDALPEADMISAGDLLRALDVHAALAARQRAEERPSEPAPDTRPDAPNVTPLTLAERKRNDP